LNGPSPRVSTAESEEAANRPLADDERRCDEGCLHSEPHRAGAHMTGTSLPAALLESGLLEPDRMLLFWSSRSPYVRKVMIVVHERGLTDRIALAPVDVSLTSGSRLLSAINPLGQIPTLVTLDRTVLYDSAVICDYLDTLGTAPSMAPSAPTERNAMLRRHALAQGAIDAMMAWRSERNREDTSRNLRRAAYREKIERALDAMEAEMARAPVGRFDLADATLASALGYAIFREVIPNWATGRTALAGWYRMLSDRPSILATAFRDPVTHDSPSSATSPAAVRA
jgi:glutathione S-transferase